MGRYHHPSLVEREGIMCLVRQGKSIGQIALALGRSRSTVSRELGRNSCARFYRASTAQRRYESRREACRRPRFLDDGERRALVQRLILQERWSPEQVAGRAALELGRGWPSASTIYRAIARRDLDTPELARTARGLAGRLRHRGKRRHRAGGPEERRGKMPGATPISERPAEAC